MVTSNFANFACDFGVADILVMGLAALPFALTVDRLREGSQVTGMFDGQAYSFRIDDAFNADGGSVGNDIRLTAAPEPATWLLMGLAA
jgi:hypothetical protein